MLVSNLGPEVTDEDLKELFVEHGGPIKKAEIFYKQDGTSSGQGEVVFKKRADADKAIKTLNNVPLDGKPLQLALVGVSSAAAPQPARGAGATTYGSLSAFPPLPLCIPLATSISLPVCMRTREVALKLCLRNRTMTLARASVVFALSSVCSRAVPALAVVCVSSSRSCQFDPLGLKKWHCRQGNHHRRRRRRTAGWWFRGWVCCWNANVWRRWWRLPWRRQVLAGWGCTLCVCLA